MKKNNQYKGYRRTILLVAILLITILIISLSSINALDLKELVKPKIDTKITKTYDEEKKEINLKDKDVKNILDGQIIKQTLKSDPIVQVEGLGEQLVQRYEIDVYEELDEPFRDYETYFVNNNESINRNIKIRYGIPYGVINFYAEDDCTKVTKPDEACSRKWVNETEIKTLWVDFSESQLKKLPRGRYDIGVFAEVKIGDYVEGIPSWFGSRMPEFASWNSTWEVDLEDYFAFEETADDLIDIWNYDNNGTNDGADYEATGKNNDGWGFLRANTDEVTLMNSSVYWGNSLTIRSWIYPTSADDMVVMSKGETVSPKLGSFRMAYRATDKAYCGSVADSIEYVNAVGTTLLLPNHWYHIVCVFDIGTKTAKVYVNGTLETTAGPATATYTLKQAINVSIGKQSQTSSEYFQGTIDELAVWSGVKTAPFITADYDNTAGIFYTESPPAPTDNNPNVTLNTPADSQDSNINTYPFNISATDDIGLLELKFYINDTLNQTFTNTTYNQTFIGFNQTIRLPDGVYNWTGTARDLSGQNHTATARTITIHNSPPIISTPLNLSTFQASSFPFSWVLNVSVSDPLLEDCWYYHTDNATIWKYTCNVTRNLKFQSAGTKTIYYYANDSYGNVANRNDTLTISQITELANFTKSVQENTATHISIGLFTSENITQYNGTLIYNGTKQTTTNLTINNTYITFNTTLTTPFVSTDTSIPLSWSYYVNNLSYNSTAFSQTVLDQGTIGLSTNCSNGLVASLTFHFEDEINDTYLTADYVGFNFQYGVTNPYDSQSNGNFSNIDEFSLCINDTVSANYTLGTAEIEYELDNFGDREYYLINSSISNVTVNITLYLLHNTEYDKYFFTLKEGTSNLQNHRVVINKYFINEAQYKNIGIRLTDNDGDFVEYLEPDKKYRFFVFNSNNNLVGTVDRTATCESAPCTMSLNTLTSSETVYGGYYDRIGVGVYSNLSFNVTTKVVTLDYVDSLGTATYGQLIVEQITLNRTNKVLCDTKLYSISGTITCNLSSYDNLDFVAGGYISRSPALPFEWIFGLFKDTGENLGLMGIFITLILLVTIFFAFKAELAIGVLSIPLALTILQIATFLPLSWASLVLIWGLAVLIAFIIRR